MFRNPKISHKNFQKVSEITLVCKPLMLTSNLGGILSREAFQTDFSSSQALPSTAAEIVGQARYDEVLETTGPMFFRQRFREETGWVITGFAF